MKSFQSVTAIWLAALLAVAGCSPKIENRGYVRDGTISEMIVAGRDSKDDVITVLGSPSSHSTFGPETWYYITTRKETTAFLAPEVVEQDVVRITFDDMGMVSNVEGYNLSNSQDIDVSSRETPTEGHELSFIEQLMGNIGRFNKDK
ncbi:MAG: outer membrane protein assembly factor BamE, partial [Alphaproteobacteria bacterium]